MGHSIYGPDRYGSISIAGVSAVNLAPSVLTIGGLQYDTSLLSCDLTTNGFGGLDTGSLEVFEKYYLYAVLNGTTPGLVASKNVILPAGFEFARKVAAFWTGQTGNVIQSADYGKPGRDVIGLRELSVAQSVPTAVNHFVVWDTVTEDTSNIMVDNENMYVPEDGYYTLGGQALVYNLNAERHSVKIRAAQLPTPNIAVNDTYIPVTNQETSQPVPRVERFLQKGWNVNMNVDSTADSSYNLQAQKKTWISLYKKGSLADMNWD